MSGRATGILALFFSYGRSFVQGNHSFQEFGLALHLLPDSGDIVFQYRKKN